MFTLSGVTVSEGVSEGKAFLFLPKPHEQVIDLERHFSVSDELTKYRSASREFANKLSNAMAGTVPDKVRDLFGAVASYITNESNINQIAKLITEGQSASMAAENVLISKIARFAKSMQDDAQMSYGELQAASAAKDSDSTTNASRQAQGSSSGLAVEEEINTQELFSLMREFISSINTNHPAYNNMPRLTGPSIVIASDLSPALFLSLHTELVRAVILEGGQASNHLSTVLRDLRIPAIYGVKGALTIKNGEHVLVDASRGTILVEPPLDTARALIAQQDYFFNEPDEGIDTDDLQVTIAGSMGAIGDIERLSQYLGTGLGLLRSEFLFLNYTSEPSCEEMTKVFSSIFKHIPKNAPLTARTFDFAGDKTPLFTPEKDEVGPLRKYGAQVGSKLLYNELRALLLAASGREMNIVFPLITRISEARSLCAILEDVVKQLDKEQKEYAKPHVALMIETPAAVLSARAFASFGEMFLIGTSSLAEYASAPRPPEEYFTPALSKMIAIACKAAHDEGVKVGIAGRFAMRTELLPFFFGLGVSYITTDASAILKVRKAVQQLSDQGLEPHFDVNLYHELLDIASVRDLQKLLNQSPCRN